ncbi:MAG: HYR domain-containing protein, partial [Chloroflexi bacterium]|nr:HYR domain-containing protein [Chloroflexota bacterium]
MRTSPSWSRTRRSAALVVSLALLFSMFGPFANALGPGTPTALAAADAWSPTGSLATGRFSHTATLLTDGSVLVAAGFNDFPLGSAERYNPATGVWSATGNLTTARAWHTATLLSNGKVLVAAGGTYAGGFASSELYDPASGTWSATGSLAGAREYHTATLLPNGKVLAVGGLSGSGAALASAELYDPASGVWSPTGSLATARGKHAAVRLNDGSVLVVGGRTNGNVYLASAERYDPATGAWSSAGTLATARTEAVGVLLPNGNVLTVAGLSVGSSTFLRSTEVYDPATNLWTTTGDLTFGRSFHTAVALNNGKVLAVGGAGLSGDVLFSELYDPATGVWTTAGPLADSRRDSATLLLANGKVLTTGGLKLAVGIFDSPTYRASAELFEPAAGTAPLNVTASARTGFQAYTSGTWTKDNVEVTGVTLGGAPPVNCQTVTVATEGANQSASVNCTDGSGVTLGATFTGIFIDKTMPAVSATATVNGAPYTPGTWTHGPVVATFQCSDTGSGLASVCPANRTLSAQGDNQTATGSIVCDGVGNCLTPSLSNIRIDLTAPTVTAAATVGGALYTPETWTRGPVTVTFTCADTGGSALAQACPDARVLNDEGDGQSAGSGLVCDAAGNCAASAGVSNIRITRSLVVGAVVSPPSNAAGWNNTAVTVGPAVVENTGTVDCNTVPFDQQGAGQIATVTCTDGAGNSSQAGTTVNIDLTPPTITEITRNPQPNARGWHNTNVMVSAAGNDALSGLDSCDAISVQQEGAAIPVTVTCRDRAGLTKSYTETVKVDKTSPGVNVPFAVSAQAPSGQNSAVVTFTGVSAGDALSQDGMTAPVCSTPSGSVFPVGLTKVTCSATDGAGNMGQASFTVTVASPNPLQQLVEVRATVSKAVA